MKGLGSRALPALLALMATTACDDFVAGRTAITAEGLAASIRTLSSDEFHGRAPATPGEARTVGWLVDRFRELGLQPGHGDSYTQTVPLVRITALGSPTLQVSGSGPLRRLAWGSEFVASTRRTVQRARLEDSELVFVGYGIVAPEYGWNDYEGLDVAGKTVVMLVNDPGYATQDSTTFRGRAMTYYGRWTYKYEEAARQGARGALIVHETGPAGYPWEVVQTGFTGPQFDLPTDGGEARRVEVEGWVRDDVARRLFEQAGHDFDSLRAAAARPGFRAVPVSLQADLTLENRVERSESSNVIAVVPGAVVPQEYVLYTAHWDHLGTGPDSLPDAIYNGAVDNATGVAALLEIAKAFLQQQPPPERSIVFLAVTAEEQGLLGSRYYAEHPVFPTAQTAAVINIDGLNVDGPMRDITVVGYGASTLDDALAFGADLQGRTVRPEPEPEKGFYYRSDHFNFAKVGIPALYTDAGVESVEHGAEWTLARRADYTANRYHKPSDEFDPGWDLSGAVEDVQLLFWVGHEIAHQGNWPRWKDGSEFKAIRDADRAGADTAR